MGAWPGTLVRLGALLGALAACQRPAAEADKPEISLPRVEEGTGLLFTFFDNSAQMRTVDQLAEIPRSARPAVMLTSMERTLPEDQVFVADLSEKDEHGRFAVWVEQRGEWLDRVMPRASVAKLQVQPRNRAHRVKRRRSAQKPSAAATATAAPPAAATTNAGQATEEAKVVMFSTSWCPSCRHARQFFAEKQVKFVDLDVENDPRAAERMVAIQRAQGMQVGSVPLIVVGNRAYQGFSRLQLEGALAQL